MANLPSRKWAITATLPRHRQSQSTLVSLSWDVKEAILKNLLQLENGKYLQAFRTTRRFQFSLGSRKADFYAGTQLMRTCQILYEDAAEILYEYNVLGIRSKIEKKRSSLDGTAHYQCQLCFLDQAHKFNIGLEQWPKPSSRLFERLASPAAEVLNLFSSIRKFYQVQVVILAPDHDSTAALFWTCRLLQSVLERSRVCFKFRDRLGVRYRLQDGPRNLALCKLLRCASVGFESGIVIPSLLEELVRGTLRADDHWKQMYKLQRIVTSLPQVKRQSFRVFHQSELEFIARTAFRLGHHEFLGLYNKFMNEYIPLWILAWRDEGLRWHDRMIREAREEIQALRQSQVSQWQIIHNRNAQKKDIFLKASEAFTDLKHMTQGDELDDLVVNLDSRRFHIVNLSPIRLTAEVYEVHGNSNDEEGKRASGSRAVPPKRLVVHDFDYREQKRRRTG